MAENFDIEHNLDRLGNVNECYLPWSKNDEYDMQFHGRGRMHYKLTDDMVRIHVKMRFSDWLRYYRHKRYIKPKLIITKTIPSL